MALSIRPARPDDLDRAVAIHASAFPDERTHADRARYLGAPPWGEAGDLWVAVAQGGHGRAVVGHVFLFPMRAWFGGRLVTVGGIASLGVAPEARGQGVAAQLMDHVHGVAAERGDAATVLYPFREAFYRRMGYGVTRPYRHLRFSPQALAALRGELRVEAATGDDRAAMIACRDRACAVSGTGALLRPGRLWDARLADEARVWLVARGESDVEGYIAWTLEHDDRAGTTLVVRDLVAASDRAARSLWSAVGAQRDQVLEVRADVADDDPIDRALVDGDRARAGDSWVPHAVGAIARGPMVRLTHAARALGARGYAAAGRLVLDVEGERLALDVGGRGGPVVSPATAAADLSLDRATLASVAYGALDVAHAARLGLVGARDAAALAAAGALFALPAYFSPDPF